jgi:hypothetical protein
MGMLAATLRLGLHLNFGSLWMILGQYEKASAETLEGIRRPSAVKKRYRVGPHSRNDGCGLADACKIREVNEQVDWAVGKPGAEQVLSLESDTEAWFGTQQCSPGIACLFPGRVGGCSLPVLSPFLSRSECALFTFAQS